MSESESNSSRPLFNSWLQGAEATLQASFDLHNALLDAASTSSRTIYQEWGTATRRAQSAALNAFRAQVHAAKPKGVAA